MKVQICAPNSVREAQYVWHVHAVDCRDLRRYFGHGTPRFDGWQLDVDDDETISYQVARDIYGDHITDYGWTEDTHPAECREYWEQNESDVRVFPCCGRK